MTRRQHSGRLLWVAVSVLAFGAAAWWIDGASGARRFPEPLEARDLAEVEAVLAKYRRIHQDLYASGGSPDMLNEFPATAPVKHRIFREIGFLRDAGLVHVHDLATAKVIEAVAPAPGFATVTVMEEWNTQLQRAADRDPAAPLRGLGQAFRYTLARVRGAWVVTAWDLADAPAPAPRNAGDP